MMRNLIINFEIIINVDNDLNIFDSFSSF